MDKKNVEKREIKELKKEIKSLKSLIQTISVDVDNTKELQLLIIQESKKWKRYIIWKISTIILTILFLSLILMGLFD